jgi:predicted DNA-binding transcriptional regulator YafY
MSQATRIRDIIAILEARPFPVPKEVFLNELEVASSTFKRDLDVLRDSMQAPIEWRPGENGRDRGYVLTDKNWSSGKLGLPKTWFTASEIYGLLMIDELASHIGPGILTEHIQPLIARISIAMSAGKDAPQDIRSKIKILKSAAKRKNSDSFEIVAEATVKQKKLRIDYFTKSTNKRSERIVSPQRLIHYKENWYLFAWCHQADNMRMFALDSIESAHKINEAIYDVDSKLIDDVIGTNFGIFSSGERQWAKLKFSAIQARWVQNEEWHPDQKMQIFDDGSLVLDIPFSNPQELILEIMRLGPQVEVLEPVTLRQTIKEQLAQAIAQYS